MHKILLFFCLYTSIISTLFSQEIYRCQEVSAWWIAFGVRFVPHQAVRIWTSEGQKVIHLNLGCEDFENDVCYGTYVPKDWDEDEDPIDAVDGVTVQKILDNVPTGYDLISNNCFHFKNSVLKICKGDM